MQQYFNLLVFNSTGLRNVTSGPFKKIDTSWWYVDSRFGITDQVLTDFQNDEYDIEIFRSGLYIFYQK